MRLLVVKFTLFSQGPEGIRKIRSLNNLGALPDFYFPNTSLEKFMDSGKTK